AVARRRRDLGARLQVPALRLRSCADLLLEPRTRGAPGAAPGLEERRRRPRFRSALRADDELDPRSRRDARVAATPQLVRRKGAGEPRPGGGAVACGRTRRPARHLVDRLDPPVGRAARVATRPRRRGGRLRPPTPPPPPLLPHA